MPTPPSNPPAIDLQPRDVSLLIDLFESRMITIRHAATLYFGGNKNTAQRRLQRLAATGVIAQKALPTLRGNAEAVYFYTYASFQQLRQHGRLSHYSEEDWIRFLRKRSQVAASTIRHELAVLDIKALLKPALENQAHIRVIEFGTIPALYEFPVPVPGWKNPKITKPDGFLRYLVHSANKPLPTRQDFFLEVDRGSETLSTLVEKVQAYQHHYEKGGYLQRHGHAGARINDYGFRVLFVMPNAERLNNFLDRLVLLRYGKRVWATTQDELAADPLAPVWRFPAAYREVVEATPYDPRRQPPRRRMKPVHQPARDAFIEQHLRKWSLLEDPRDAIHRATPIGVVQYEDEPAAMS